MQKSLLKLFIFVNLCWGQSALAQISPASSTTNRLDEVIVTASPFQQTLFDQAQPVSVLSGQPLKLKIAPTLGETLSGESGISSSSFSAGASRPIIRGLADNRVLILNNGTDVFDVSNLSPDHAPTVNALISQKIEVVRGPATILYGSNAIGGVVNVVDNRIPTEVPSQPITGELDSRFNSADLERSGAGSVDLRLDPNFVFHFDATILRSDSYSIPGPALSQRIRGLLSPEQKARGNHFGGDPHGTVPNTFVFTRDFGTGLSYVSEHGFIGISFSQFLSHYGVADDPEVDDAIATPEHVTLDVTKRQYSLHGGLTDPVPGFSNVDFRLAYTDYKHDELDDGSVGATFKTSGIDSRLELTQKEIGSFNGALGAQFLYKELSVLGGEAFLQPTKTYDAAVFAFEEYKLPSLPLRLQIGGRVEYNTVSISSDDPDLTSLVRGSSKSREFLPLSVAGSAIYDITPNTNAALTVRYSERAPTAEELFARGAHDATFQFIIGDPDLSKERVLGVDLTIKKRTGIITGSVGGFYNHFFDFIDFSSTGDTEDGLRVFNYTDKRANFLGGEVQAAWHLLPQEITSSENSGMDGKTTRELITGTSSTVAPNPHDLFFEVRTDYVHAQDETADRPLPRIPPWRYSGALVYQGQQWSVRVEGLRVESQDRVSEFETETGGYTFLNASLDYTFSTGGTMWNAYLRGTNLTNEEARNHSSFLKEVAPLPGRGVLVGLKLTF